VFGWEEPAKDLIRWRSVRKGLRDMCCDTYGGYYLSGLRGDFHEEEVTGSGENQGRNTGGLRSYLGGDDVNCAGEDRGRNWGFAGGISSRITWRRRIVEASTISA
jgi:hypothetical protein